MKIRILLAGVISLGLVVSPLFGTLKAEQYPNKSIKVIVGFSAGGGTDTYGRILSSVIAEYLNQPFVIVNKTGGAQVPAMKLVARSKNDGYTLMVMSMGSAIIATGLRNHGVDLFKDFELISQVGVNNVMLAAPKHTGYKSPQQIIAAIKKANAAGKKLRWANTGRGSITTLCAIAWLHKNGVYEMTQDIPFKGGSKVRVALLGDNVDFGFLGVSNATGFRDKYNVIAVFSDVRDPVQKDVPTMGELKTPYVPMETPVIIAGPKGIPKERIAQLAAAIKKATGHKAFKSLTRKAGQAVVYRNPEETVQFARKLKKDWDATIKIAKSRIAKK
jgi:tripartite-type tricarboxylate transporter receptor subunit TctC